MAIKVSGTEVISDSRGLNNIASVDATTVASLSAAGVGGGGTAEFTAAEAITAGDAVALDSNGQVAKVFGATQADDLFESGDETSIKAAAGFEEQAGGDLLLIPNTSKAIWFYNFSSTLKAQVLSISGTAVSKIGSEVSISSRNPRHTFATWGPTSGDKFAVVFTDSSGGDDGFVALCSYNSSTDAITVESETNISTEFSTQRSEGTCVVYDESASAFLFAFRDGLVSNGRGYVGVATLSGTTWTFGTTVTFNSSFTDQQISLVYDNSLSLSLLVYLNSSTLTANRITVSGTTPTVSSGAGNADITWSAGDHSSRRMAGDGAGRFVACYDSSSNTRYILIKCTVSSTSIVNQTELDWYNGSNYKATQVVVGYHPYATPSAGSILGRFATVGYNSSQLTASFGTADEASTNTLGIEGLTQIDDSSGNDLIGLLGMVYVPAQSSLLCVGAGQSSTSFAFGVKLASNFSTVTEFVGLAAESISASSTGDITVIGGVNDQQSGLTSGSFYYLSGGGGLSTTATDYPLGLAQSSTNLLVGASAADYQPAALGAWQLIDEVEVTANVSSVDLEGMDSTYQNYAVVVSNAGMSSGENVFIRFKNGGSYDTSSIYSNTSNGARSGNNAWYILQKENLAYFQIMNISSIAQEGHGAMMYIYNPASDTVATGIQGTWMAQESGQAYMDVFAGSYNKTSSGAVTGIRFYPNNRDWDAGNFRLYGIGG